jgi:hypothetical protein
MKFECCECGTAATMSHWDRGGWRIPHDGAGAMCPACAARWYRSQNSLRAPAGPPASLAASMPTLRSAQPWPKELRPKPAKAKRKPKPPDPTRVTPLGRRCEEAILRDPDRTNAEIAAEVGCSEEPVRLARQRLVDRDELAPREKLARSTPAGRAAEAAILAAPGRTDRAIAGELGLARSTVSAARARLVERGHLPPQQTLGDLVADAIRADPSAPNWELVKRFKCSPSLVQKVRRRLREAGELDF